MTKPRKPLRSGVSRVCREPESNWRHQVFQTCALPTELSRRIFCHQFADPAPIPSAIGLQLVPVLAEAPDAESQRPAFTTHFRRPSPAVHEPGCSPSHTPSAPAPWCTRQGEGRYRVFNARYAAAVSVCAMPETVSSGASSGPVRYGRARRRGRRRGFTRGWSWRPK